ncbi:hypothetical protein ACFFWD_00365 [Bradyrhizobium erythrophlei]|uniref:hypothetical protein n=1 Tax=Bradyrhizobium erythrophlei TaxID=1437360 RepID=UPI0035EBBC35
MLKDMMLPDHAAANYQNNRAPLAQNRYVKLPLGAIRPSGWLLSQLNVQANSLTSHIPEVWSAINKSVWKGDAEGREDTYTPRYGARWLEGLIALAGVLHDDQLMTIGKPYIEFVLAAEKLADVTPNVTAWFYIGRLMPEYYELTGDRRAIQVVRRILDFTDSMRESILAVEPLMVGMLLSFGIWYYNQTGEKDVLALLDRCTKACVDDWTNYFANFPQDPKYFVRFPDVTSQKFPDQAPSEFSRHGVRAAIAVQYPVLHSLISSDRSERDVVVQGMTYLDEAYGQVGGRWAADEWFASRDPVAGTELCAIEELLFSLENNFAVIGDVQFADRIEQLIFNAFPGTCTADMWAHQYDQQANQVLVSVARRPWHWNIDSSNIYGFTPNFPCCLSNMHSPWPRYVESMWMATPDNGLIAMGYGPCRFSANVAEGKLVEITEETDYPFSDRVRVTVHCKEPLNFPLYFRIPSWANRAEVSVAGEAAPRYPQSGAVFKVEREWKDGDVVTLNFNFKVRTETRQNNAVAVAWGPLYFVLRIGQAFEKLPSLNVLQERGCRVGHEETPPGCVNWRIAPVTDWNYALSIDRNHPQCEVIFNKISSMPFAQKGEPVRTAGSTEYLPWQDDVPMILKVKAELVPQWGMNGANAAPVPVSPVCTAEHHMGIGLTSARVETVVELIPYGCSRLRIAEFPTV